MRAKILLLASLLGCWSDGIAFVASAQDNPTTAPARDSEWDLQTVERIRHFRSLAVQDTTADEKLLSALNELSKAISDDHLPTLERFAATDEAKPIVWPLARLLVERHRLDTAGHVMVTALLDRPAETRQYAVWKWWEASFGERADYKQLSDEIAEAFMKEFANGPDERKMAICDLFGRDGADAKLSIEEFRKKLHPTTQKS